MLEQVTVNHGWEKLQEIFKIKTNNTMDGSLYNLLDGKGFHEDNFMEKQISGCLGLEYYRVLMIAQPQEVQRI